MNEIATHEHIDRPTRWDAAFDPEMSDDDFALLMDRAEIKELDAEAFPRSAPLEGLVRYDMKVNRYAPGEIVVREGDYGNSAFLILEGELLIARAPGIPEEQLGRVKEARLGVLPRLKTLFGDRNVPEKRDTERYQRRGSNEGNTVTRGAFLQDVPAIIGGKDIVRLSEGTFFGELAALGRVPRSVTIFAEKPAVVMEMRWQGLRDIMKVDRDWRNKINELYRSTALDSYLRQIPLLEGLDEEHFSELGKECLFETYGGFDWHVSFNKAKADEPVIAKEGDYPDGLLVVRAGFARVSKKFGNGVKTLTYLGAGDMFGLDELFSSWKGSHQDEFKLQNTISALGYVDVIRIPVTVLERHVFPGITESALPQSFSAAEQTLSDSAVMEWALDKRYMNGTQSMVIDLDKCMRCDDCVRACASTHDGNPRFRREGEVFDRKMVANACMHCKDPVCMIGCPTGAIHRSMETGSVLINDDTCIGCATCANSCPYKNIVMVPIRGKNGAVVRDSSDAGGQPIVKATKCDLCAGNPGGPACVRACPHDALSRIDFRNFNG
ncbi:MAG: cyclic nucleotide-binding domain-containing protein [Pseudomonadota bacterium]|nr:cyclic nucleotide-binding domain-containing protein [Pseudomonadota bacterium]